MQFARFVTHRLATTALILACSAGGVNAAEPVRIAFGDVVSTEDLSLLIPLERAKAKGIAYQTTSFSKEELAIQAVVSGQADIGIATPYAIMQKSKAPVRIIFQQTRLVFFPTVVAEYKTWKDLNGQPFVFHGRGSGTETIGNILAKRNGIEFGQRSYVAGSGNRVVAMLSGQIKATILDLPNKEKLLKEGGNKFHVLPSVDTPASDELLFASADWLKKNPAAADAVVEELVRFWREMAKDPKVVEAERAKRGLLKDQPKEVLSEVTKFYTDAWREGVFHASGGSAEAAKSDFEFYVEGGQMEGPAASLKVEDYWDLGPLDRAKKKLGG